MGIQARHERERVEMRRKILDAARALLISDGFSNVSVRKVADRIEYSPSAIYSYFGSMDEVFLQLAEEGFRMLASFRPAPETHDPITDLRHNCLRYYEFSKAYPDYFSLMFLENVLSIIENRERFTLLGGRLREQSIRLIRRCVDAGSFPKSTDATETSRLLWATIHGPAVLGLTWPGHMTEQADSLALNVIDTAIAGLSAGSGTTLAQAHSGKGRS